MNCWVLERVSTGQALTKIFQLQVFLPGNRPSSSGRFMPNWMRLTGC